jgi:hypothetical protein
MEKHYESSRFKLTTKKVLIVFIFLSLGYSFVFGQEHKLKKDVFRIKNDWWSAVFKKHNIELEKFNYLNTFSMGTDTTSNIWLELGTCDSISGKTKLFRNAIIISKNQDQPYSFMTFQYAQHDFENSQLILKNGHWADYNFNLKDAMPIDSASIQEILVDIKMNSISYTDFKNLPTK